MLTGRVEIGGQNRGGYASVLTMGLTPMGFSLSSGDKIKKIGGQCLI